MCKGRIPVKCLNFRFLHPSNRNVYLLIRPLLFLLYLDFLSAGDKTKKPAIYCKESMESESGQQHKNNNFLVFLLFTRFPRLSIMCNICQSWWMRDDQTKAIAPKERVQQKQFCNYRFCTVEPVLVLILYNLSDRRREFLKALPGDRTNSRVSRVSRVRLTLQGHICESDISGATQHLWRGSKTNRNIC